jgi:uncharacterized protein YciI
VNPSQMFAVLYIRGPKWNEQLPFHKQEGVGRHRDFLASQHEAGTLLFGGPFLDDTGGLAVYTASSRDELVRALAVDETIADGLLRYELHPYVLAFKNV